MTVGAKLDEWRELIIGEERGGSLAVAKQGKTPCIRPFHVPPVWPEYLYQIAAQILIDIRGKELNTARGYISPMPTVNLQQLGTYPQKELSGGTLDT